MASLNRYLSSLVFVYLYLNFAAIWFNSCIQWLVYTSDFLLRFSPLIDVNERINNGCVLRQLYIPGWFTRSHPSKGVKISLEIAVKSLV